MIRTVSDVCLRRITTVIECQFCTAARKKLSILPTFVTFSSSSSSSSSFICIVFDSHIYHFIVIFIFFLVLAELFIYLSWTLRLLLNKMK